MTIVCRGQLTGKELGEKGDIDDKAHNDSGESEIEWTDW